MNVSTSHQVLEDIASGALATFATRYVQLLTGPFDQLLEAGTGRYGTYSGDQALNNRPTRGVSTGRTGLA